MCLLRPETFLTFSLERELVAKALLRYDDDEMSESVMTIVMFEVLEQYRNQGLGRIILRWIENGARHQDTFNRGTLMKKGFSCFDLEFASA